MSGNQIRTVLLQVIGEYAERGPGEFQQDVVLRECAKKIGLFRNLEDEQALLTVWHDLFRSGHLAWGYNLSNPAPPFCHLTERGRRTLENLSRDPANPDGYMQHLYGQASINPIAESYIREALHTYNGSCFKAAAVMVGAAAENVGLELRGTLVARMTALGKSLPRKLNNWRIKTVLDAIEEELNPQKKNMPRALAEAFSSYWPAFTGQIRLARNEAGHPSSVDPVTPETVHAALLIFPELAKLASELTAWINNSYS